MKDLPDDHSAPVLEWGGTTYRTILSTGDSGGAMSIVESVCPAQSGPPRHVHAREDETFVILEGEVEFWLDGRTFRRRPGGTAFVPRGADHTYKALTDARVLVVLTPGGFEGFFAEMARGAFRVPEDMPAVLESAERHHLAFTGPPI
jgi:quercetin dioxygenase-like cupin family protein